MDAYKNRNNCAAITYLNEAMEKAHETRVLRSVQSIKHVAIPRRNERVFVVRCILKDHT